MELQILWRLRLARRNECSPGLTGLRVILSRLPRDRRNAEEHITGGTLDLAPRELLVALQMLLTFRAEEFELTHKIFIAGRTHYRWKR